MAMREMSSDGREREEEMRREDRGERREAYFLLLNNKVGSEQFFPMHWGELFTSQGREAAVV